jgi:hypothetical protein
VWNSWHRNHAGDLRDAFAKIALDTVMQGHRAAGATIAGTVEADLDGAITENVNQLDVTPVSLHGRADEVDHFLYAILQLGAF